MPNKKDDILETVKLSILYIPGHIYINVMIFWNTQVSWTNLHGMLFTRVSNYFLFKLTCNEIILLYYGENFILQFSKCQFDYLFCMACLLCSQASKSKTKRGKFTYYRSHSWLVVNFTYRLTYRSSYLSLQKPVGMLDRRFRYLNGMWFGILSLKCV